jgi:tetraether lipid synthase
MPARDYLFLELTISICSQCLEKVEAKVIAREDKVYLVKNCLRHGKETVLIADDYAYWRKTRTFLKPADLPRRFNMPTEFGCPYDCGLCPDHEQHSCLTLIELTDRCNLSCPTCYADSGPGKGRHRTFEEVERMLDVIVENEGEPDIVQLSGGEPTLHPEFFRILESAQARPIRHLMVNTNGVRIARDAAFAKELARHKKGFEVYLQFDSLTAGPQLHLRGEDLRDVRRRALERLNEYDISTTLVVTVKKGLNDAETGDIVRFALEQPCVRGVTFQPVQAAGRLEGFDPARDRCTLTEIRRNILEQCDVFTPDDIVPVPCNPDNLAMAYAVKHGGKAVPLTRYLRPEDLLDAGRNTIVYEQQPELREKALKVFSTARSPAGAAESLKALLCCLPLIKAPSLTYRDVFRVIIMQFLDVYNFDVRGAKKSCVHIVDDAGKIIPFDTMNLFYRNGKIGELRKRALERAGMA